MNLPFFAVRAYVPGGVQKISEGPKGGRRKGGRGRKLSHFSFCCAFRCCVVYSPCFPVWGEEKVMTIYDAGPLAAGPLCGLLISANYWNPKSSGLQKILGIKFSCIKVRDLWACISCNAVREPGGLLLQRCCGICWGNGPLSFGCTAGFPWKLTCWRCACFKELHHRG